MNMKTELHGTMARFVAVFKPGPAQARIVTVANAADGTIHIRTPKWEDTVAVGEKVAYHRQAIP